jgi:hypothetical protein
MTAFEDYVNKGRTEMNVMPESVNEVRDRPYLCLTCDRVWSYSYVNGLEYYEDFPRRQPRKECRNCEKA